MLVSGFFFSCSPKNVPCIYRDDMYFAQKNPSQLANFLGKLYVFSFVWSFGGNFRRDENLDDDGGIIQRGEQKQEVSVTYEFDNFVHEIFDCIATQHPVN